MRSLLALQEGVMELRCQLAGAAAAHFAADQQHQFSLARTICDDNHAHLSASAAANLSAFFSLVRASFSSFSFVLRRMLSYIFLRASSTAA